MSSLSCEKCKYIKTNRSNSVWFDYSSLLILLICLLYLYACWYVQTFSNIGFVIKGTIVGLVGVFVLHILYDTKNKISMDMVPKGIWINYLLIAYCFLVGLFVAYNVGELINSLIIYTGYIIASMVICYVSTMKNSIDWFLNIVLVTALFCSFYALTKGERYYGFGLRLSAHNNIHIFSVVLFFGIFALAYKTKNTIKSLVCHFIPAIFLVYCIVESTSRKCLIASLILIAMWLFCSLRAILGNKSLVAKIVLVLIIICILFLLLVFFYDFFLQSRLFKKFETFTDEESNSLRIDMYRIAWQMFLEKPLFGGGFDQYQFWSGSGSYSHSSYAEAIADLGFFGTVLYFIPIIATGISLFRLVFRKDRTYHSQITLALFCAEIFLGIGQIFFLEPQHIFIFSVIYWVEMNEQKIANMKKKRERKKNEKVATKYLKKSLKESFQNSRVISYERLSSLDE